jgi:hypothetical protein
LNLCGIQATLFGVDDLPTRQAPIRATRSPPPKNAVRSADAARNPTSRDRHIDAIATQGRMGWQKSSGYNQRSRIEAQMSRWKTVIGPKLKARTLLNQRTETAIGVSILNRMSKLGRAEFERVA